MALEVVLDVDAGRQACRKVEVAWSAFEKRVGSRRKQVYHGLPVFADEIRIQQFRVVDQAYILYL